MNFRFPSLQKLHQVWGRREPGGRSEGSPVALAGAQSSVLARTQGRTCKKMKQKTFVNGLRPRTFSGSRPQFVEKASALYGDRGDDVWISGLAEAHQAISSGAFQRNAARRRCLIPFRPWRRRLSSLRPWPESPWRRRSPRRRRHKRAPCRSFRKRRR